MELVRDLMFDCEERDWLRLIDSNRLEHLDDLRCDAGIVLFRAVDLVVSQLERHGQPVSADVAEPDLERLHHILGGNAIGFGWWKLLEGAGESAPSVVETLGERVEVVLERDPRRPRCIEVNCKTAPGLTKPNAHGCPALHDS
jgi:hypothetical protein